MYYSVHCLTKQLRNVIVVVLSTLFYPLFKNAWYYTN